MSVPTPFVMPNNILFSLGLPAAENTFYQLSLEALQQQRLERKKNKPGKKGTLALPADNFTSQNHFDCFIVKDGFTVDTVDWNTINQQIEEKFFNNLYQKMVDGLSGKEIWIRDSFFPSESAPRISIRSINGDNEGDWFIYSMLLHPDPEELTNFDPKWYLIGTTSFTTDPETDGVSRKGFIMASYTKKVILMAGVPYTAEIKELVLRILNFAAVHNR